MPQSHPVHKREGPHERGSPTPRGSSPDLVTGLATRTTAGIELIEKLSGIRALNVLDQSSLPQLRAILKGTLNL